MATRALPTSQPVLPARVRGVRAHVRMSRAAVGGALVLAATLLWQLANFAFTTLGGRVLGPSGFGQLAAVMGLLYAVSPLMFCVQAVAGATTARMAAGGELDQVRAVARYYAIRLGAGAVLLAAAAVALSGVAADALRLPSGAPVVLLAASLPLAVVVNLQRGVLQGAGRAGRVAASTAVEAVSKLAVAAALLLAWHSVEAALAAVVVALACAAVAHAGLLRALPRAALAARPHRHPWGDSALSLATLTLLAVALSADVVVARHVLPAHAAGVYAGASLAGKIAFFASSGLNWLLFPSFAGLHERGERGTRALARGLAVVGGGCGALAAIGFAAPALVVRPLLGARYAGAEAYVGPLAAAFALYAVAYLSALFLVARRSVAGVGVLAGVVALQLAGLACFHGGAGQIAAVQIVAFGVAALALVALCVRRPRAAVVVAAGLSELEGAVVAAAAAAIAHRAVLLAGSRATGAAAPGSDVDAVVIVPLRRMPVAILRLRRAEARLAAQLGVSVTLSPMPPMRLRRPGASLFVEKLRREGRVLAAVPGFALGATAAAPLDAAGADSYALSGLRYLTAELDPRALGGGRLPEAVARGTAKALLHAAQLALLADGRYAPTLPAASEALADDATAPWAELAANADAPATWMAARDLLARHAAADGRGRIANLQYVVLTAMRGRGLVLGALFQRRPVGARLAEAARLLAAAVMADGGVDAERVAAARAALPGHLRRSAGEHWPALRDLVEAEWPQANPLLGL